jgi:hypothetical protein
MIAIARTVNVSVRQPEQHGRAVEGGDVGRRVVVRAHGQPSIGATHDKTLEVTGDPSVSPRATCVVGVGAVFDPADLALLRGPVTLALAAGGLAASGEAVVNPTHAVGDRIVVRRSDHRDADTLAVRSTLVASDLDPALVRALADPHASVTLTVAETGERRPLVLVGTEPFAGGRLGLLWRHADARVDLRGPVRAAAGPIRADAGPVGAGAAPVRIDALEGDMTVAALVPASWADLPAAGAAWLAAAARGGARFAAPAPHTAALLAAGLPAEPAVLLGRVDRRAARAPEVARLVAAAPVPAVLTVPVADADAVLGPLAVAAPDAAVAVEDDPMDVGVAVRWTTAPHAVAAVGAFPGAAALVVLPARRSGAGWADVDALVRRLAAAGIPPRTLSEALGPLGVSRRAVYDALGTA